MSLFNAMIRVGPTAHVDNRISNCRRSFYGLSSSGMCYPGLSSEAKSYIWKTVCSPVLTYGLECVYLKGIDKSRLKYSWKNRL